MDSMVSCEEVFLGGYMYAVKNILFILMIAAPILLAIRLAFLFFKGTVNPDEKNLVNKIKNSVLALGILFFIPTLFSVVLTMMGDHTVFSSCWKHAEKPSAVTSYIDPYEGQKKNGFIDDPKDYEKGVPKATQLEFTNGGDIPGFSSETRSIVQAHMNDFNYNTFKSFMAQHGGAGNYIKSLGGVFTKYYGSNKRVTTVREFQEVSEYVFGLMVMYGFDYYSGSKYCKWGGNCEGTSATSDAFYPAGMKHTQDGLSDHTHFDNIVTGKNEINMTTNCNWTVDMVYTKAGIWSGARGSSYKSMCRNNLITDPKDFRVGDVVHFFRREVNYNDVDSWGDWYHVAYIGEVYEDKVVLYDGGSYLTINRNHKRTMKRSDFNHKYAVCRVVNLQ